MPSENTAITQSEALAGRLPCLRIGRRLLLNLEAVQEALIRRAKGVEHA